MLGSSDKYPVKYLDLFSKELLLKQEAIVSVFKKYMDTRGMCYGLSCLFAKYISDHQSDDPTGTKFLDHLISKIKSNLHKHEQGFLKDLEANESKVQFMEQDFFEVLHYQNWQNYENYRSSPSTDIRGSIELIKKKVIELQESRANNESFGLNYASDEASHIAIVNLRQSAGIVTGFSYYDSNEGLFIYNGNDAMKMLEHVVTLYQDYYSNSETNKVRIYTDFSISEVLKDMKMSLSMQSEENKQTTHGLLKLFESENEGIYKELIKSGLLKPSISTDGLYSPVGVSPIACKYLKQQVSKEDSKNKLQNILSDLMVTPSMLSKYEDGSMYLPITLDTPKKLEAFRALMNTLSSAEMMKFDQIEKTNEQLRRDIEYKLYYPKDEELYRLFAKGKNFSDYNQALISFISFVVFDENNQSDSLMQLAFDALEKQESKEGRTIVNIFNRDILSVVAKQGNRNYLEFIIKKLPSNITQILAEQITSELENTLNSSKRSHKLTAVNQQEFESKMYLLKKLNKKIKIDNELRSNKNSFSSFLSIMNQVLPIKNPSNAMLDKLAERYLKEVKGFSEINEKEAYKKMKEFIKNNISRSSQIFSPMNTPVDAGNRNYSKFVIDNEGQDTASRN